MEPANFNEEESETSPSFLTWVVVSTNCSFNTRTFLTITASACAAGVVRIALAFKSDPRGDATCKSRGSTIHFQVPDLFGVGDLVEFVIWSSVEECIGIICACVPTLASLFQQLARNRSQKKDSENSNVRPRYTYVNDNIFDRELHGLRSSNAQYELSASSAAKEESAESVNAGDNQWHRKVEVTTPERIRLQIPGEEIKVDTTMEWRSDKLPTEMRV